MNDKLQPALIGGVFLGLLSIIPFVSFVNFICCAWAILGGALATYLYVKKSPTPVKAGDGAVVGLLAGAIGALIYIVIGIPVGIATFDLQSGPMMSIMESMGPQVAEAARQAIEEQRSLPFLSQVAAQLPTALLFAVVLSVFALIGGLIGVPLFEKRKGDTDMPPPPPNFGGGSPMGGTTSDFGGTQPGASSDTGAPPPAGGTSGFGTER